MQIHEVVQCLKFQEIEFAVGQASSNIFMLLHDKKKSKLTKNFNFKSGSAFMLNYLWCYLQCRKWCNLKPLYGRQNSHCVEATTACISRKR